MKLVETLKAIDSVTVLFSSDKFINIMFDIKHKSKVLKAINKLPITIYTEDGLTTATIYIVKKMKIGSKYHIDTERVSQYKGERVIDTVSVLVVPTKAQKKVLVHSPKLQASVLVFKSDLKHIVK